MKPTIHFLSLPAPQPSSPWLWWLVVMCSALGSCWLSVALDPGAAL